MQSPNFKSTRQTSRRRPLKLLPGFESSCRLPIPSRRELRTSNFELSTSNFSPPELQIKRQTSCRRPLRLLPASNPELQLHGELRIEPPASNSVPRKLQIKRASIEIRLYKG